MSECGSVCGPGGGADVKGGTGTPGDTPDPSLPGHHAPGPVSDWTEHAWVVACPENTPGNNINVDCPGAHADCPPPDLRMWRWERPHSVTDGVGGWTRTDAVDCRSLTEPDPPPRATPAEIAEAVKHLPFPRAVVHVQPDDRTVMGLETIFWTRVESQSWSDVVVAGEAIDVRASASTYTWDFGDGAVRTSTSPGAPYPDQDVTHAYRTAGETEHVHVTVRWQAEYRHAGESTWEQVPDRIDGEGLVADVPVAAAHSQLIEDPV
ncbi:hypothetical protein EV189_2321 [Motilibacter rhizosphaerae]|uniref:PKD domain-containing protein n=1 Tax=Motilibacter rhizosphaerae TaxID=598652 RepID=A0A4Q7NP11_9ACTN|nr:PKD domain-containing protein [Motilibacter rhizosphaerae]RZS86903.1 hypothetical protein EV189_2321 [Motilibacter rhizosphaerae]